MKQTESLREWLYSYEINVSIPELICLIIFVSALLLLQGWLSANDAKQYEYTIEQKERAVEAMTGVRDCHFNEGAHSHIWKDACYVSADAVKVMK